LERIETGVYKAAEMFGQGSRSLLASFQIEQKRIANVVRILTLYRKSISTIQREMLRAINWDRTGFALFCEVTKLLLDMQYKMAEADNLYLAMQFLMAGNIPHFLISHKLMAKSLILVEDHLQITEPHMTLVRHDFVYYYSQAPFKTFMVGNVLFIIIDAPVTNNALKEVFSVYELTRLPLPTPETDLGPLFDWLTDEQTPSANTLRQHSLETRNLWRQCPAVHLSDGLLVRKLYDSDAVQMVVPHRLRKPLFDQSHSGPLAAHLGAQRTFLQLRSAYYWPGMKGDVVRWTKECETCAQCKGPPTRRHG